MKQKLFALWKQAFGDSDREIQNFFHYGFVPENTLVLPEGEGAVYWLDCRLGGGKAAYLYALAVDKSCQNRGLGTLLLTQAERILAHRGYCAALLVPGSEELTQYYARRGYSVFSTCREVRVRAAQPVELEKLSAREFARQRESFLPENAVGQESCLPFFATQVDFYRGDGFLVAARAENGGIFAPEVLGTAPLGAVCAALGAGEGRFRIQGTDRVFAMVKPLGRGEIPQRGYLGWALD